MRTWLLICLGLLLSLRMYCKPIDDGIYIRYYFDKMDLPQLVILQIEQDARGYLWLATEKGVYRFDGNEAVPLADIVPGNDEVLKQYIPWIMVDNAAGVLWMSTGYVYEFKTGCVRMNKITSEFMQNPPLIDTQGNLWISYFDKYVKYGSDRIANSTLEIPVGVGFTQSEHYVWGMSRTGVLHRMSIGEGNIACTQYNLNHFGLGEITVMCAVSDDLLLLGTKYTGLWLYDVRRQTARQIFQENYIRNILSYSSTEYWIATENGIYIYDIIADTIDHWTKDPYDVNSLQDHAIYSFYKDSEGGNLVW